MDFRAKGEPISSKPSKASAIDAMDVFERMCDKIIPNVRAYDRLSFQDTDSRMEEVSSCSEPTQGGAGES
jgi:hypothetical protein